MSLIKIAAVVLAAGKGTRIKASKINKVMFPLNGKPMISYTYDLLLKVGFKKIIIVVGFAKESIINYLENKVIYSEQKRRLGTAHALKCALKKLPLGIKHLLVCYSDDSAFYPPWVLKKLIKLHLKKDNDLTFLTVIKDNPSGLGRIIRDKKGNLAGIVEEKNTSFSQKKIKEINTGVYCFKIKFLKMFLPLIKKDPLKKEYYLTDIVALAIEHKQRADALKINQGQFFQGVNTREELKKAEMKMKNKNK